MQRFNNTFSSSDLKNETQNFSFINTSKLDCQISNFGQTRILNCPLFWFEFETLSKDKHDHRLQNYN
jgi:hypothetical protein